MRQILVLLVVLVVQSVSAETPDNAMQELLRNSRIVYDYAQKAEEYQLVLSSIKKIDGRWVAENQRIVDGLVSRKTYELDSLLRYRDAQKMVQSQVEKRGGVVFSCAGLDCGSSNAWANQFLKMKRLYGMDAYQYYAVVQFDRRIEVYYLIQRGNQKIYLQHDTVQVEEDLFLAPIANSASVYTQVLEQGYWVVSDRRGHVFFPGDKRRVQQVADFVALELANLSVPFAVVGHASGEGSSAKSVQWAERFKEALISKGVKPEQITVFGGGAFAPRKNTPANRLEIVLLRDS